MTRRGRFVGVFLVLIFSGVFIFLQTARNTKISSTEISKKKSLYQCSMHPTIVSEKPDNCPICGMRLTRMDSAPSPAKPLSGKKKVLYYRNPMRGDIVSPTPAKDGMGMDYIPVYEGEDNNPSGLSAISGHAEVVISPERQQLIGIKTATAEERELVKDIPLIARVAYDPELYQAELEYLQTVKKFTVPTYTRNDPIAQNSAERARLKLITMGISEAMILQIEKDRIADKRLVYAKKGEEVWVYASIYEYEIPLVKVGDFIKISVPSMPEYSARAPIVYIDSSVDPTMRTLRIRALVPNDRGFLKPGMFVDAVIQVDLGTKLAIPEEAVLDTGERQLSFVDKGEGRIEPREIQVGYAARGYYEVLKGLSVGEKVISSANFLIDSESRLRAAAKSD